jgi:hypothetical protein
MKIFPIKPITILLATLIQWTWGALQNLLGLVVFLICIRKPHAIFRTAVVTLWDRPESMGCGMFVFLTNQGPTGRSDDLKISKYQQEILFHEYGHTLQSLMLGPLFLPVIGIPSFIWASLPFFDRLRRRHRLSYYWLYCEKWATNLGNRVCAISARG